MSLELKLKAKCLSAEAALIRKEEAKLKRIIAKRAWANKGYETWEKLKESLTNHRRNDVAKASRNTHIARAFLMGMPYEAVELKRYTQPDWNAISKMVEKYARTDDRDARQRFEEFYQAAKATPLATKRKHEQRTESE